MKTPDRLSARPAPALDEALTASIRRLRNRDGGWGYYAGRSSRIEPTAWAALALTSRDGNETAAAVECLGRWRRPSGLLAEDGLTPNLSFNGVALVALASLASGSADRPSAVLGLARALAGVRGAAVANQPFQRQDNTLRGWPWSDGAFSWVEPTSWCLLALKRVRRDTGEKTYDGRIAEAERLLFDRASRGGGWNYGNSNVFGQELQPYVPTTAVALLALQDQRDHPVVVQSLRYLEQNWHREESATALGLAGICLSVFGRAADGLGLALGRTWERTRFLDNAMAMGIAVCALGEAQGGQRAFQL